VVLVDDNSFESQKHRGWSMVWLVWKTSLCILKETS